ncbi:MAG: GDSL-type esterase/lipase family protein [Rubripirellula sp.]
MKCHFLGCLLLLVCVSSLLQPPVAAQDAAADFALPASDEGLPGTGPIRRYGWFTSLWKNRRAEFAKRAEAEKNAVVFLGDSITQGWGDDFRGDFKDLTVANRGISGDTTRGMLLRLEEDVLSLEPSAVVMLMGTNDLEEGAEPASIAGNVALIVKALEAGDPEMPIVLCLVFPSSASKKRSSEQIKKINQLMASQFKGNRQVTIVDTWTLFADEQGDAKKSEFPDLLHPNRAGYEKWLAAIWPVLATHNFVDRKEQPQELEPGFTSLFNGKDLSGWGYRRTSDKMRNSRERWLGRNPENAPAWPLVDKPVAFEGLKSSPDGRYAAINGRLVVTTPSEGRAIQQLWTTEEFTGDFVLKLEFRATPNADSGVFIRGPQLQCRDFPLAGPYKNLKRFRQGDWNELVITVKDSVAHCTCNGEVIEEALKIPESGPIGLEGDRGQLEYRRLQIKRL